MLVQEVIGTQDTAARELAVAIRRDARMRRSQAATKQAESAQPEAGRAEQSDELEPLLDAEAGSASLSGDIDALLGVIDQLDNKGRFHAEVRIGRAVSRPLALAGRWVDLLGSLRHTLDAAERTGDADSAAWAAHELGTLHLCAERALDASQLLGRAREMRFDLGDRAGLAATEHNLQILCRMIQRLIRDRRLREDRELLRSPLALGLAILLLLVGVIVGVILSQEL
jgi:hypothetical protein